MMSPKMISLNKSRVAEAALDLIETNAQVSEAKPKVSEDWKLKVSK